MIVLLTQYAAVLPHEFGHSFMAWISGIRSNPWNIEWLGEWPGDEDGNRGRCLVSRYNQREHALGLAEVKTGLADVHTEIADIRQESRARLRSVDEHLVEIKDLIIGRRQ